MRSFRVTDPGVQVCFQIGRGHEQRLAHLRPHHSRAKAGPQALVIRSQRPIEVTTFGERGRSP
jgi:hypothetical protein